MLERVIVYIDGYNLYYGLRTKGWKWAYWLNIQVLAQHLLKPAQNLVNTKYFTSIVKSPPDTQRRQAIFLEALQTLRDIQFFYGHFLSNPFTCHSCGSVHMIYHEKMTDVNIAVEMITDAFADRFDVALLVSADSDLVGPINAIRTLFPKKRVIAAFPPARNSEALKKAASGYVHIGRNVLYQSLFPDSLVKPDGIVLHRPGEWH